MIIPTCPIFRKIGQSTNQICIEKGKIHLPRSKLMKNTYIYVKIFIFTFMFRDVNDETPTFRSKSYVGEISENSPRATPILFLGGNVLPEVFDHDSGTNGTFQLFLEGDQGIFEVISFIFKNVQLTVWSFHDFPITQILREIKYWDSRSAKSAILTHLEALNFDI